jgi:hypothetical protein
MKKIALLLWLIPVLGNSQITIGVKAGYNFVNVTKTAGINADSRSGFMIGGYIAPKPKN